MPDTRGTSLRELSESGAESRSLMDAISDFLSQAGSLRYGVSTAEKERLARAGVLRGSPTPDADAEEADRYAAGYLFARQHPTLSAYIQPVVSRLKVSDAPIFGGSSPELQSYADAGANQGRLDALRMMREEGLEE